MTRIRKAEIMPKMIYETVPGYVVFCTTTEKFLAYTPHVHPSYSWVDKTTYILREEMLNNPRCNLRSILFEDFLGSDEAVLVPTIGYYGPEEMNKAGDGRQQTVFFTIDFRYSFGLRDEIPKLQPVWGPLLDIKQQIGRGLRTKEDHDKLKDYIPKVVSQHNRLDCINIFDKWVLDNPHFGFGKSNFIDNN